MATVSGAAPTTLSPVSTLCGAAVTGGDGEPLGTIAELMIEAGSGRVVYAALSAGGVLGVGERLFAVPWGAFRVDPHGGALHLTVTKAEIAEFEPFDKDAWPTEGNASFTR